ncbi:hypothetical protein [Cognatilysobacter bugurensis]|uniref:hypothetical protein n=1 Tax=Cognatilysobacter bugurensis TaxID=543356 RepID=UPI001E655258|nr:hypothetical protein [Lysobacter bugurensis]
MHRLAVVHVSHLPAGVVSIGPLARGGLDLHCSRDQIAGVMANWGWVEHID